MSTSEESDPAEAQSAMVPSDLPPGEQTPADSNEPVGDEGQPRRGFLGLCSFLVMSTGMAAGYGALAAIAGRFLYPSRRTPTQWQFVAQLDELSVGQSLLYTTPSGAKVVVARQQPEDSIESFVALSSVCPHLGCAVHWESNRERFFCPCHNGAFDKTGQPTEGPPAAANQSLTRFPLKVENGLLYIAVSTDTLTSTTGA